MPDIDVPEYPKDLYDAAHIENGHRDFNDRLRNVRSPNKGQPEYVPPPVPAGIAATTELEMKAGAERVAHFAAMEEARKGIAARTKEKWEGDTVAVFRPPDFDEYKATFKSQAQTPSKDTLKQPVRK